MESFYITTIDQKNNFEEWNATAKMGSSVYLSKEKDRQGRQTGSGRYRRWNRISSGCRTKRIRTGV